MTFDLYTLTPWFELDDRVAEDIETLDDALDQAQSQANDRDRPIQLLYDGDGSRFETVYPDDQVSTLGADPLH